jgi:hypothetical protein
MKVKAKNTYPQLNGFFKKGDVLELTPILYTEDTKVMNAVYGKYTGKTFGWCIVNTSQLNKKSLPEGVVKIFDEVIAEKGTYKGYKLTNKKGVTYCDGGILNMLGYKSLSELFDKV